MPEMELPSTLQGAVNVDTKNLEDIFQSVMVKLDQQGAQIAALTVRSLPLLQPHEPLILTQEAMLHCGSSQEIGLIFQRLDQLESQVVASQSGILRSEYPGQNEGLFGC